MIGLLALTALPTTIAVAEGISSQKRAAAAAAQPPDEKLMRKFHLRCYCAAKSGLRSSVHGGDVVVRDGKVYISRGGGHGVEAFYVHYPDDERPCPPPLGLVTSIASAPPTLNWLYVHKRTAEVLHGNRTQSRPHRVGPWGWVLDDEAAAEGMTEGEGFPDEDAEGGGGGLTLGGEEMFVVVEPEGGEGEWEVRWDERDDGLKGVEGVGGRRVLRVSLEREFVEGRGREGLEGKEGKGPGKEGKEGKEGGKKGANKGEAVAVRVEKRKKGQE